MSAGRGIYHSEKNNTSPTAVHFIQMWVLPDTERVDPSYEQLDINGELAQLGRWATRPLQVRDTLL